MNKFRKLVLVFLALMFVFPSLVQFGSVSNNSNFDLTKNYMESYIHHDQIWIQSNEEFSIQAAAESWAGDGSYENPYVITGYLFDCESQPLRIWHTTVHWIFIDNVIDGVGSNIKCGTFILNITHGSIVNNEIYNRFVGIAIESVQDFNVTGNYIHDCWGTGIEFLGTGMNSTIVQDNVIENIGVAGIYSTISRDCVVKDNSISNCDSIGIALLGQNSNCNVTGNNITYTNSQGLWMNTPSYCVISENTIGDVNGDGLRLTNSIFSNISENKIKNCTEDGFLLSSGTNTSVHWNSVSNVTGYAVNLRTDSSFFSVKFNTFIDNGVSCQVCDDGTSNLVSQNYYDDWSSPDVDTDGYVDSPYALDGDAENQDDLPLAVAGVVPTETVTTSTTIDNLLPMDMLLIAGAIGVIILVAVILVFKRR